ncbi:MAG TPA: transaldolase [Gemmatimonadaceae bacterium]|nr:transaldolase [Gemmatimonadaceae bacterium]
MPRTTAEKAKRSALHTMVDLGQSPWLDFTARDLIRSRELHRLIAEEGVRGLTTNPTIFERAIARDSLYDADIIALTEAGFSPEEVLERLMAAEVQEACDAFGRLYHESLGRDGYVSLEVAPQHAWDAQATVAHARHLWELVGRRNLMLKIPGTREGLEAIEECLALGMNVNVTLVFSVERYAEVIDMYLSAIGARRQMGLPLDWVSSVASFFVGRVDEAVDRELERIGTPEAKALKGRAAIANATLAWEAYTQMLAGPVWRSFATEGARVQRPLWASTGVKDPSVSPLRYCEALVAPATVSTLQPATLRAYRTSGRPEVRLHDRAVEQAHETAEALARQGVSLSRVGAALEEEGVAKFTQSWTSLLDTVERKAAVLATRA